MKNSPPRFFLNFFRWFCHPQILDYIEGDLIEVYRVRLKKHGKRNADLRFIIDVLLLFRPGIIRPAEGHKSLTNYGMIKSYFKIGWRNLLRNKGYSFINIGGLAIGMMVAILNGLWIWHEFSYNKNFENYDRIAKVAETGIDIERGNRYVGTTMTYPLSTELSEKYRQHFREVVRASFNGDQILSSGETMISANGVYVGETAPDVFTFKMLQGTRKGLANMNSILISESLAEALFGTIDVLNRAIRMNNKSDVVVTGVYEDFPDNSEFNNVRFFAPWSLYLSERPWIEKRALNDWRNHFLMIYVEIDEGTSFETVQSKVKGALHFDPADQERASKNQTELYLYPMSRWHLHPPNRRDGQYEPVKMIQLVGAIGLFVL